MARTAVSELQQQIEEVRREAFAAGYAAAMQAIRKLASAPGLGASAHPRRSGARRTAPASAPTRRQGPHPSEGTARTRKSAAVRPQRGSNAQIIQEIVEAAAPRALRQAEIRKALQEKGRKLAFTSIRHALAQLEARNVVEQVGTSRTWPPRGCILNT